MLAARMKDNPAAVSLCSDNSELSAPYVNVTDEEAVRIARTHYDLDGSVVRFATEKDDTFRFEARDGNQFVLKIANPSEDQLELDFQVQLMRHVARVAPDLPVPRVCADTTGRTLFKVKTDSGSERFVRLMSYMAGTPLDRTTSSAIERERIGELLAQLRLATAGFAHAADSRILAWDVTHLLHLRHLLAYVEVPAHHAAAAACIERFETIAPALMECRTQVLHNDFNTSNIVVDHGAPGFVTGIIDFGDAVRTAIAVDVSTALMNQLPRNPPDDLSVDIFQPARDVVRGYLRHADLTDHELKLIPHLAMGRVVTRALLTTWRAQLFPENSAYILRHTPPGWLHLNWFLARSSEEISGLLSDFFN